MTAPTRVAGTGLAADGSSVTWTVAEGRRGRRWREVVSRAGAVVHALLLETDVDRRFSHLELARGDGLWTFHPEPDGTLHGNHVGGGAAGEDLVRHVTGWPFGLDDVVLIEGSPISLAAIAWHRAGSAGADEADGSVGSVGAVGGIVIGRDGALTQVASIALERPSSTRWRIDGGAPFEIDAAGLPLLAASSTRPLELD